MHSIEIVKPGLLTTIQDLGRTSFQQYGISAGGAMDRFSLRVANLLVGNAEREAGLEMTLTGPEIRFDGDGWIAVTGSFSQPIVNGEPVELWSRVPVVEGDLLRFRNDGTGCRGYMAVRGGLQVPDVMGSKSTFLRGGYGGLNGRTLRSGDRIPVGSAPPAGSKPIRRKLPERLRPNYEECRPVRFIWGPQREAFESQSLQTFVREPYVIRNESDRMGYRLNGPRLHHADGAEMISDYIAPGSVQVPGDGQPIVLMSDCQVTGGYPKIGVVIRADMPYLAQRKPGEGIRFQPVDVDEAQWYWKVQEKLVRMLGIHSFGS